MTVMMISSVARIGPACSPVARPRCSEPLDTFEPGQAAEALLGKPEQAEMGASTWRAGLTSAPRIDSGFWVAGLTGQAVGAYRDGQELWRVETEGVVKEQPILTASGQVIVAEEKSGNVLPSQRALQVSAYDSETGEKIWHSEEVVGPLHLDKEGRLFARGLDKSLVRLDPKTGEVEWSTPLGLNGVTSAIESLEDQSLLVRANSLFRIDAESGQVLWTHDAGSYAAGPDAVLVPGAQNDSLRLLDLKTGESRGDIPLPDRYIIASVQGRTDRGANLVWVQPFPGQGSSRLMAVSDEGRVLWSKGNVGTDLVFDRKRNLYIAGNYKELVGIDGDSGRVTWRWEHKPHTFPDVFLGEDSTLYAHVSPNTVYQLDFPESKPDSPGTTVIELEDRVLIGDFELDVED